MLTYYKWKICVCWIGSAVRFWWGSMVVLRRTSWEPFIGSTRIRRGVVLLCILQQEAFFLLHKNIIDSVLRSFGWYDLFFLRNIFIDLVIVLRSRQLVLLLLTFHDSWLKKHFWLCMKFLFLFLWLLISIVKKDKINTSYWLDLAKF